MIANAVSRREVYETWNRSIANHFFSPEQSGRPVYLQVDEGVLRELAPSVGAPETQAESEFIHAVRGLINFNGDNPFWRWRSLNSEWKKSRTSETDPPPYIGILALSVLAASKMQRDASANVAPHNYYFWLNQVLGNRYTGRPPGFEDLAGYWSDLRDWLNVENQGRMGICTAVSSSAMPYVSYPISQCLLRKTDRLHLPDFFDFAGFRPREEIDPVDILGPLGAWCQRASCPLLTRTKRLILEGGSEVRHQIAELVAGETRVWDGEDEQINGYRSAAIDVRLEVRRGGYEIDFEFYPRRPRGFPDGTFQAAGTQLELRPIPGLDWYEPVPVDVGTALERGLKLTHGRFTLGWKAAPLFLAALDGEGLLGGYISRTRAALGEPLVIVCKRWLDADVEQFLSCCAHAGWRRAAANVGLPPSWIAYTDVVISSVAASVRPELEPLIPDSQASIRLSGGLKLDGWTWLAGAEPEVFAASSSSGAIELVLDGVCLGTSNDGPVHVDLSELNLEPGVHVLSANARRRQFQTVRSGDFIATLNRAPPELGHRLIRRDNHFDAAYPSPEPVSSHSVEPGELWAVGAAIRGSENDLPENLPSAVTLPGGGRHYVLLGRQPGMVFECGDPHGPAFAALQRLSEVRPFEVEPPFEPVWLIRESWRRHLRARRIGRPLQSLAEPWQRGDAATWRRWLRKARRKGPMGLDEQLWQHYVERAARQ